MSVMKLYVGNLPFSTTEDEMREKFSQYGEVDKVSIVFDRETQRPRGFGFVEMLSGGDQAMAALNQTDFGGRTITVNEAKPREPRAGGSRGGYGGSGGRGRRDNW